jgi:hypothetical protein
MVVDFSEWAVDKQRLQSKVQEMTEQIQELKGQLAAGINKTCNGRLTVRTNERHA